MVRSPIPQVFPERAAPDAVRGFVVQSMWAVLRWLELDEGAVLVCEGDEDIQVALFHSDGSLQEVRAEQVKSLNQKISARTQSVHQTIFGFMIAFHEHQKASRQSHFVFTTNAVAASQQLRLNTKNEIKVDVLNRWQSLGNSDSEESRTEVIDGIRSLVTNYNTVPPPTSFESKSGRGRSISVERVKAAVDFLDEGQGRWHIFLAAVSCSSMYTDPMRVNGSTVPTPLVSMAQLSAPIRRQGCS